jgi:hypothetical protein
MSVATTGAAAGSPLWTTAAVDFPFDLMVGGEVVTAGAAAGTSSPQAFQVLRSINGIAKAQASGADVSLYNPAIAGLQGDELVTHVW